MSINAIEQEQEIIDWERLFRTREMTSFTEQDIFERKEDFQELEWLIQECELKLNHIPGFEKKANSELKVEGLFRDRCKSLSNRVSYCMSNIEKCGFSDYIDIKYDIRTLLKQLSGLVNSDDWLSPAMTLNGSNHEKGERQQHEDIYMRMNGHEYTDSFQNDFINQYVEIPENLKNKTLSYLTNSGMKALELALVFYKTITKDKLPTYIQEGYYFEGITLINNLCYDAQSISINEIYSKLKNKEKVGCLLLDPGTTWPIHKGVDLDVFFTLLMEHKQRDPLFIIIDRTITSISNQLLEKYKNNIPSYVVLIVIESGIKYYQLGLDLVNLGFITITGNICRFKAYRELVTHLVSVLSVYSDPTLLYRLPNPNLFYIEKRLKRMSRNTNILIDFYSFLKDEKLVLDFYYSVSRDKNYQIKGQSWLGTLLYIKHHNSTEPKDYLADFNQIIKSGIKISHFNMGSSFGFDTHRFGVVEEMFADEPNCALRVSVGKQNIKEILESSLRLRDYYVSYI